MLRALALLLLTATLLLAQPTWKEFSLGPATPKRATNTNNIQQGILHADSITLKTLIGIAAGVPWVRVLGPDWLDTEHFAIAATISDETRLRLRTREETRLVEEFRSLLTQELVKHFQVAFHRETRDTIEYTLQAVEGTPVKLQPSAHIRERGRLNVNNPALARNSTLEARNINFRALASWLQNRLKGPVTADAALPATTYDFRLSWKAKDEESLIAALKKQLGLELVEERGNKEFLIVDRAEKPAFVVPPTPAAPTAPIAAGPDSSIHFDPAALRRDLRIARDALIEGHPGVYRYTSRADLDRAFTRASAQITRRMTGLEFYRVLAPVVAALKCGHTSVRPSRGIQQRLVAEPLLPFEVAVLGGKVYVARDSSSETNLAGAEIRAINGTPIDRVLAMMLAVVHGDGDSATAGPYQLSHNRGFARNLYLLAGLQSPFRVEYAIGDKVAEATVTGMLPGDAGKSPRPPAATWRLIEGGTTGVLKVAEFDGHAEDGAPLGAFFEHVFTTLHDRHAANLIVDVRDNGGGEDELGRRLFAYFADRPFRYYRDLIVNKLAFRFFQYVPERQPLPPSVHDMVKRGADGKYHVTGHSNWGMQQPAEPHFAGKVLVLMNGGSFSTTCEFLATLHHRGGVTFIGEETAGGYYGNTSGAAVSLVLPTSKLILPVQLVGYYLAIDGATEGTHGIRPDHAIDYSIEDVLAGRDKAMETALRLASAR